MAGKTAYRVLRFWNLDSDSNTQIELEGEIWLSSTLVMYGAVFQIISVIILVFAADHFAGFIKGAMCATGSFLANDYGMALLYVKLFSSFYAGIWIVIHRLDVSSEHYPLVRFKYLMLLFLVPIVLLDFYLQTRYIAHLTPDIITSCCAIVFDSVKAPSTFSGIFHSSLWWFYSCGLGILILGFLGRKTGTTLFITAYAVLISGWLILAIDTIISTLSSYIYAMPYHNCPFCIVKAEYHFIGFFIYILLFGSVFYGFNAGFIGFYANRNGLSDVVKTTQKKYLFLSMIMHILFMITSSFHLMIYLFLGGEEL